MKILDLFGRMNWVDGTPLLDHVEDYRRGLFVAFADTRDDMARHRYNLGLWGRSKKNWKTADLILNGLHALFADSPHGNQCYLVANDKDQARDDLDLGKLILRANPAINELLVTKRNIIERKDGQGFIEVLPAQDAVGQHGKTYRWLGCDEIHGWRDWDLLEALAHDPHRGDCQQLIVSYASLIHRPGAPLHDLFAQGKRGDDPRMLFSWYAADYTTDEILVDAAPEVRANPSMGSWGNPDYLEQQQRRLPAHKFRRLHLNLPGMPEGAPFQAEPIMDAIDRDAAYWPPAEGVTYRAFVDMSGGSNDDAVLAIGHRDADGRFVVDRMMSQGTQPPFDPRQAIERFASALRDYRVTAVTGDRYAGETFRRDFERHGIQYAPAEWTASQVYEALEPRLNAREVAFPNVPRLEQQLLGLIWRGGKIDHPSGEHDDWSNAAAGVVQVLAAPKPKPAEMRHMHTGRLITADELRPSLII